MPRRLSKRQTNGQAVFQAPSAGHSSAIVRVDGTRIRKKIKKDYEKALRDLINSRQKLDQFHQTDLPQFTRWLNMNFGVLLTELRGLNQSAAGGAGVERMTSANWRSNLLFAGHNSQPAHPMTGLIVE
jgi:hypothetical protein